MSSDDRVMIFIDGSNFYHGLRRLAPDKNIDFGKLAALPVGNRRLVNARYYNVHVGQEDDKDRYRRHEAFLSAIGHTLFPCFMWSSGEARSGPHREGR